MHVWYYPNTVLAPQYPSLHTPYWSLPWTHLPPPALMGAPWYPPPRDTHIPAGILNIVPPYPIDRHPEPPPKPQHHKLLGGWHWPMVVWDVRFEASEARRITRSRMEVPISDSLSGQAATRPPVRRMRITFKNVRSFFEINIPPTDPKVIRVKEILEGIHQHLHEPLYQDEWEEFGNVTKSRIYDTMLERLTKAPPTLHPGPILNIDCLLNKTMFMGLEPVESIPEEWRVKLGTRRA